MSAHFGPPENFKVAPFPEIDIEDIYHLDFNFSTRISVHPANIPEMKIGDVFVCSYFQDRPLLYLGTETINSETRFLYYDEGPDYFVLDDTLSSTGTFEVLSRMHDAI